MVGVVPFNSPYMSRDEVGEVINNGQRKAKATGHFGMPVNLTNAFIDNVSNASKTLADNSISQDELIKRQAQSVSYMCATFALMLSKFRNTFPLGNKRTFMTEEQKLINATLAAFTFFLSSLTQNQLKVVASQFTASGFTELLSAVTDGFNPFHMGEKTYAVLWESVGQLISITPMVMKTAASIGMALSGIGIGLVALEGLLLQRQIDFKQEALDEKTNTLNFLLGIQHKTREIEIDGKAFKVADIPVLTKEIAQLTADMDILKLRRLYIAAAFFFAVAAVVLATVFSGGIAPLAIGIAAMMISLGLTLVEMYLVKSSSHEEVSHAIDDITPLVTSGDEIKQTESLLPESDEPAPNSTFSSSSVSLR